MKKLILFISILFLLSGCVDTEVSEKMFNELNYSTIEKAKSLPGDTIVIVTEGSYDYVFMKKNGNVILYKKYISNDQFVEMPGITILVFIVIGLFIGGSITKLLE